MKNKRSEPPAYQTFIKAWDKYCPALKLMKAMGFSLCDICVLGTESLDQQRNHGRSSMKTSEMETIEAVCGNTTRCKCRLHLFQNKSIARPARLSDREIRIQRSD